MTNSCKKTSEAALENAEIGSLSVDTEKAQTLALKLAMLPSADQIVDRTFENVSIAEGRWALESAGNFLWHSNLQNGVLHHISELTFKVSNTLESGVLKMQGSSLEAQFSTLLTNAAGFLAANQTLAGLDVEVLEANGVRTLLKAKISVTKPNDILGGNCTAGLDPDPMAGWWLSVTPYGSDVLASVVNCKTAMNYPTNGCYYPQTTMVDIGVSANSPIVFQTDFGTFTATPNLPGWFDWESDLAISMASNFTLPPSPPPYGSVFVGPNIPLNIGIAGISPDQGYVFYAHIITSAVLTGGPVTCL